MAKVNEQEVLKLMEKLGISREEALELVAFDNDEIDNDIVNELEEKSKEVKNTKKRSSLEKVKNMKKKKVADVDKDQIMQKVKEMVENNKEIFAGAQQLTPTKITFYLHDTYFTISVTKHKKMPDGYKIEG